MMYSLNKKLQIYIQQEMDNGKLMSIYVSLVKISADLPIIEEDIVLAN